MNHLPTDKRFKIFFYKDALNLTVRHQHPKIVKKKNEKKIQLQSSTPLTIQTLKKYSMIYFTESACARL